MGVEGVVKVLEDRSALPAAGGDGRPDALAPRTAHRPPRSLRHVPVDHDEAQRLLGQIARRLHPGRREEAEVGIAVPAEPLRRVVPAFGVASLQDSAFGLATRLLTAFAILPGQLLVHPVANRAPSGAIPPAKPREAKA